MLEKGFFKLAKNVSKNSNHRCKMGCVIAQHGKPIAVGWNYYKTHPQHTANSFRQTIHAEIKALMSADTELQGAIAYVYRETYNGTPALARPCNYCYAQLRKAGIKTVYYTTEEHPYWKKEKIK